MNLGKLPKPAWLACLLISLTFPATALIQEYLGLGGVIFYMLVVLGVLVALLRFEEPVHNLIRRYYPVLLGLLIVGFVLVFAVLYPLEDSGRLSRGSDRDEALDIAVDSLIQGQYPYYQKTPLGGEITPLPGAIFLAAPFVALGNSAYQNFFWLLVFLYITGLYLKDRISALMLLLLALGLSPAVQYEFISGGDLLANSLYVIVFIFLAVRAFSKSETPAWLKIASAVALGISLASRSNFLMVLPLLFVLLLRKATLKAAATCLIVACVSAAVLILPFYLFDPAAFTPFTAGNKLASLNLLLPFASIIILMITIVIALGLALILLKTPGNDLDALFFALAGLTQFVPIACAVALSTAIQGWLDFSFLHDRFGLMFLFLGLWGCWVYCYDTRILSLSKSSEVYRRVRAS